jgi:hypothetical protein
MKFSLLFILLILTFQNAAYAMGARRPNPPSTPTQPTTPAPIPIPSIDMGPTLDAREYLDSSASIAPEIDQFQKQLELTKTRSILNEDVIDQCNIMVETNNHFSDQISFFVAKMFEDIPSKVGVIGSSYGVSSVDSNLFPTSLIRHPLCEVNAKTLATTLGSQRVPAQIVIDKLNRFTQKANDLRNESIKGNANAKRDLLDHWNRLFSCLAYTESLASADNLSSQNAAKKYAPANYRKPAGVEFYEDSAQPAESKLNIGLFQFTPSWQNNIQSCLRAWNAIQTQAPLCQTPLKGSQADLIKIVGSSLQSFNAFCGVHKLIETFSIQVNTNRLSATHPSNAVNGVLKSAESRCVSPHFLAGRAYNHFGPFQNSTRKNLDELFSCIEKSQN